MSFKIEKVKPPEGVKVTKKTYEKAIAAIEGKEPGWYKVTFPQTKATAVYQSLVKLVKDRTDLTIHKIKDEVFIEKTE
jgi:hypothetical protein